MEPATDITPKALSARDILRADDMTRERVEVPEWGGFVWVSMMTAEGKDLYESLLFDFIDGKPKPREGGSIRAKLVAATVTDDDGTLLFTADQVDELAKKSAAAIDRVFKVASRLNAVDEADEKELAKN